MPPNGSSRTRPDPPMRFFLSCTSSAREGPTPYRQRGPPRTPASFKPSRPRPRPSFVRALRAGALEGAPSVLWRQTAASTMSHGARHPRIHRGPQTDRTTEPPRRSRTATAPAPVLLSLPNISPILASSYRALHQWKTAYPRSSALETAADGLGYAGSPRAVAVTLGSSIAEMRCAAGSWRAVCQRGGGKAAAIGIDGVVTLGVRWSWSRGATYLRSYGEDGRYARRCCLSCPAPILIALYCSSASPRIMDVLAPRTHIISG
jgi:hypothetical protein